MPGMATAHSHAFQRALRARTQRRITQSKNFWSWRDQMFRLVAKFTPDDVFAISRFAFVELAMSGVTAVGEFHYVHHDVGGKPYANRLEMSEAVIHAAQAAGIRLTLIRTGYFRGGYKHDLHEGQRRFCDQNVEVTLSDIETLMQRYPASPMLRFAVAPHSIRACTREQLVAMARFAKHNALPLHMHVSEQRREIGECIEEHGCRPVELLAQCDMLDEHFVAVHAIHLATNEVELMGRAHAMVCMCRSTERDLGDGLPLSSSFIEAGVRLCVGVDSHAEPDAFAELRAVELDDRVRLEKRITAAEADALTEIATTNGLTAIGMRDLAQCDEVWLSANDPALAGIDAARVADAVVFGATPRAVARVVVAGKTIVENSMHVDYAAALQGFLASMRRIDEAH
jgi:formiminoglutamate deiminase